MAVHDFIYMIDGEWKIGLGNRSFQIRNDDLLILPANQDHFGITPCAPKTRTMYFHIFSRPGDENADQRTPDDGITVKMFLNTAAEPNIKRLFEKILQTRFDRDISTAYINTLLYELGQISAGENSVSIARAIHDYIVFSDRILTNGEIAGHFNVSKRTAETHFKNYYHTTIHEFILAHKLKESKRYLIDYPDMKIHSIAKTLGFYDEFHFSKRFTRAFGVSPSAYRKQNTHQAAGPS